LNTKSSDGSKTIKGFLEVRIDGRAGGCVDPFDFNQPWFVVDDQEIKNSKKGKKEK